MKKVPLVISRNEDETLIDELVYDNDEQGDGNINNADGTRASYAERQRMHGMNTQLLLSLVRRVQRDLAAVGANSERLGRQTNQQITTLNRNVQRLSMIPARRSVRAQNAENEETDIAAGRRKVAELSRLPRSLHALWQEYEFGTGNRKAAKDFTPQERGKKSVKHSYYLRKFLWEQVAEMVQSGMEADVACDRIYDVYGRNQSVTFILDCLKRDRRHGGNPALRIAHI